jgi:hypothetical protein
VTSEWSEFVTAQYYYQQAQMGLNLRVEDWYLIHHMRIESL